MSLPKANEPMPSATGTHRERGNASFRAGQYAEAEQHYTAALIDCAEDYRHLLHSNRAAARIDTGDFDGALVDARACMQLDPTFAKGFFRAGQALERLGRRAEAREVYRDGIAVCDASPATRHLKEALSDASPAGGTEPPLEQLDTLIEDWADKGRVTVATRDFLPGEIIMTEKPLLVWQGDPISRTVISSFKHFLKAFADASVPTQEAVLDMYHELSLVDDCDLAQVTSFAVLQPDQIKILMATKATNAHDFGGEEHQGALFARGSLISHSCRPNANYSNHATPGKQRHTAIRPIAAGEEVTALASGTRVHCGRPLLRNGASTCVLARVSSAGVNAVPSLICRRSITTPSSATAQQWTRTRSSVRPSRSSKRRSLAFALPSARQHDAARHSHPGLTSLVATTPRCLRCRNQPSMLVRPSPRSTRRQWVHHSSTVTAF